MSDTPIYHDLMSGNHLSVVTQRMVEWINSFQTRDFVLTEEDRKEIPAVLAAATQAAGILLLSTFGERQRDTQTDREFSAYVAGLIDALNYVRSLPPPPEQS